MTKIIDKDGKGTGNRVSTLIRGAGLVSLLMVLMFEIKPAVFAIRLRQPADGGDGQRVMAGKERRYQWIRKTQSRGMNKD